VEIQKKLEEAKFTKEEISKARSVYTPVAKRGSILYFGEAGLANVMSMYEISLDSFLGVFNRALDLAKKDVVLENRLRNMINSITTNIYDYTCTGIFERHKLMFSFQMTCMIMEGENRLNRPELDFFLKGDTSLDAAAKPNPVDWLPAAQWKNLLRLSDFNDQFAALLADFMVNIPVFKAWYDLEMPELSDIPMGHHEKLTSLQVR
jgi:dynein heavy chain, axonemal